MVMVKTLRKHDNMLGDKFEKHPGKIYDHPSPELLIERGFLELADAGKNEASGVQGVGQEAEPASEGDSAGDTQKGRKRRS
jgi:hypothetical protein